MLNITYDVSFYQMYYCTVEKQIDKLIFSILLIFVFVFFLTFWIITIEKFFLFTCCLLFFIFFWFSLVVSLSLYSSWLDISLSSSSIRSCPSSMLITCKLLPLTSSPSACSSRKPSIGSSSILALVTRDCSPR